MPDLSRLLRPKSVAVIGGGAWCTSVVQQLQKAGFAGEIWPVHPRATEICGLRAYDGVPSLPAAPDAAFVGINRDATIGAVERLRRKGAGGAVCFASGFAEVGDGSERNQALLQAAGEMPILGPNCYGMINALDGALLWPDQHGCVPVDRGVAILTQSSNIAINLTMQKRALPLAYVITAGNQAQVSQAAAAMALLEDPRVTAIGLHVEGFGSLHEWQALARAARVKGIPLVVLKVGRSQQAQTATASHTASLAGGDAGAQALLDRLGIARVDDLPSLLETLKLLHVTGPLPDTQIASISCSGGEASLIADMATNRHITFPELTADQEQRLFDALGPRVTLANPLDYHTYIWRDTEAMAAAWSAMSAPHIALTCLIVDFPREDRCDPADWDCAVRAALLTRERTGRPVAMVATLPELMPEPVAQRLLDGGVVPLAGLEAALSAIEAASVRPAPDPDLDLPVLPPLGDLHLTSEADAKSALASHGLAIPKGTPAPLETLRHACAGLTPPLVLKGLGYAHKSEAGAVALHLGSPDAVAAAARGMHAETFLIEEMVQGAVAELLIGIHRDPAHGLVLTIGAGGVMTEILQDSTSVLIPASEDALKNALSRLRIAPVLKGFRGRPAANQAAILDAIMALQSYALANAATLAEIEVNPLICTPSTAVAADALLRKSDD